MRVDLEPRAQVDEGDEEPDGEDGRRDPRVPLLYRAVAHDPPKDRKERQKIILGADCASLHRGLGRSVGRPFPGRGVDRSDCGARCLRTNLGDFKSALWTIAGIGVQYLLSASRTSHRLMPDCLGNKAASLQGRRTSLPTRGLPETEMENLPISGSYLSHRRPSSVGRNADSPPMKLGLVENCWWSSPVGPVDGIRLAKEIGFDSYDVFFLDTPASTREAQRKALQECGLPCSSFIVAANGLTDFVPEMRKFSVGYVKQQVDLGLSLGSPTMVLVLGNYSYEQREFKPAVQWEWALEGVREIADYCNSHGIEIALEYVPYRFYLLNSVSEMCPIHRRIRPPLCQGERRRLAPVPDGRRPEFDGEASRKGDQRTLLGLRRETARRPSSWQGRRSAEGLPCRPQANRRGPARSASSYSGPTTQERLASGSPKRTPRPQR